MKNSIHRVKLGEYSVVVGGQRYFLRAEQKHVETGHSNKGKIVGVWCLYRVPDEPVGELVGEWDTYGDAKDGIVAGVLDGTDPAPSPTDSQFGWLQ